MKNNLISLGAILIALINLLCNAGCSTTSGGYQLKQTRDDVDWAMTRFNNRSTYGFITPQEQQQVSAAYKTYQTAFNEAVKQANGNYNTPTPANVKQLADQLMSVLAAIP
jgi:hypothetical protein